MLYPSIVALTRFMSVPISSRLPEPVSDHASLETPQESSQCATLPTDATEPMSLPQGETFVQNAPQASSSEPHVLDGLTFEHCILPEVILPHPSNDDEIALPLHTRTQGKVQVWSWQLKRRMKQRRTQCQRLRQWMRLGCVVGLLYALNTLGQWCNTLPQWWVLDPLGVASPQQLEALLHPVITQAQKAPFYASAAQVRSQVTQKIQQIFPHIQSVSLQKRLLFGASLPPALRGRTSWVWKWHVMFESPPLWVKLVYQGDTPLPASWLTTTYQPVLAQQLHAPAMAYTPATESLFFNTLGVPSQKVQGLPVLVWHGHRQANHKTQALGSPKPTVSMFASLMGWSQPLWQWVSGATSHSSRVASGNISSTYMESLQHLRAWQQQHHTVLERLYQTLQQWERLTPIPVRTLHYEAQEQTVWFETVDGFRVDLGVLDDTLPSRLARIEKLWPHWQRFKKQYHTLVLRWDEQITAMSHERVQPLPKQ
ncbi:MAG: hypothetical protein ACKO37_04335 [Vampirovibrionales bacterium]